MVGSQQANISVYIAEGDAITEEPKWSLTHESPVWNMGYLEIPRDQGNYKVVLAGNVPEGAVDSVAVDDLNLVEGTCSVPEEDNQCNFDTDWCHYQNVNDPQIDQLDWVLHTPWDPPLNGLPEHNGFTYMTHAQMAIQEESARLVSPNFNFNTTGSMCLDFYYLFTNPNHASLMVYVGQKVGGGDYTLEAVTENPLKGGGAKVWRRYRKNIKVSEKEFDIVFDGYIKEYNASVVALDRIFINKGNFLKLHVSISKCFAKYIHYSICQDLLKIFKYND